MKYTTAGMRAVTAESMSEAAEIFALRIGRRKYGRRARVAARNQTAHSQDGRVAEFSVFVGRPVAGGTDGHNINLTVRSIGE
jgi:hypothetical protein